MNQEEIFQRAGEAIDKLLPTIEENKRAIPEIIDLAKALDRERAKVSLLLETKNKRQFMHGLRQYNKQWNGIKFLLWVLQGRKTSSMKFDLSPKDITPASLHDATSDFTLQSIYGIDSFLASSLASLRSNPEELGMLISMLRLIQIPNPEKLREFQEKFTTQWSHILPHTPHFAGVDKESRKMSLQLEKTLPGFEKKRSLLEKTKKYLESLRFTYTDLELLIRFVSSFIDSLRSPEFHEDELAQQISTSQPVKRLINYKAAYQYAYQLQLMVWKGMQQRDWAAFEEFYKNLSKEETKFHQLGDDETAQKLITEGEPIHEYPIEWFKLLRGIQQEKESRQSIEKAMKEGIYAVKSLIEQRFRELLIQLSTQSGPLQKEISRALVSYRSLPKKILTAIGLREDVLLQEIALFRGKFLKEEGILFELSQQSIEQYLNIPREPIKKMVPFVEQATTRRGEYLDFADAHLARTAGKSEIAMVNPLNMAMFATGRLEEIEHGLDRISIMAASHIAPLPETMENWESLLREFAARSIKLLEMAGKNGFPVSLPPYSHLAEGKTNIAA